MPPSLRAAIVAFAVAVAATCSAQDADSAAQTDSPPAQAQGTAPASAPGDAANAAELAKKLSNPLAAMISVPFQSNFDFGLGPNEDGFRYTMNLQPVIPIKLNSKWNLISRTILPIIHQSDIAPGTSQTGTGDAVQSFFFSPSKAEPFIWGFGPALMVPTASDDLLGSGKLGVGPTLVVLKQKKGWTYGVLMNHIWSVAGDDARADVNATYMQPFLSYTTKKAWTFLINTESTYDWTGETWNVPINIQVSKLLRFGKQPVSIGAGPRCWATSPRGGASGCGLRFSITPLFPKR